MKIAVASLLPVALLGGCSDWLNGTGLTTNPNSPTKTGANQLFVGVTVTQTTVQTGDFARLFSMWVQSMAGTDRQYIPLANYVFDEDAFSSDWSNIYTGGGLIDERAIQAQESAVGDSIYVGIAKVMEALTMGTAADVWGDIPYREAVSSVLQPHLDPQQQVYADIQAQLDTAVVDLQCTGPTCAGPGPNDLWYGGDASKWLALAHTLKARYFMHVSTMDGTAYASAISEAQQGISSPDGDFVSYQSTNPNEWNLWYQFIVIQRSGYIGAGANLVNMLVADSAVDPRLKLYYSTNSVGKYAGAPPTGGSGDYSNLSAIRLAQDYHQPIVTYAENELIIAEAAVQTGDQATALAAFNAERASQGVPPHVGALTLADVMNEKYIADFEEIEVWNDWKRTCLPTLVAANAGGIPGRVLYPLSAERNSNPNIPTPDQQPVRNWNQPNACPTNLPG
ncbi:MAG TPA: SusD/RagB family nutrient-binding outer membrane lipoprotein [Gemmatimonadaceae bacterium]|nr:SusD/RagB family nutrient-binding outer membrane lipoprotein [Gemmatimonadaceae bacterium]